MQGFKELQYVDLQLDLQRTATLKMVKYFFNHLNMFQELSQFYLKLICSWFVGSLLFVLYSSGQAATSQALSQLHI